MPFVDCEGGCGIRISVSKADFKSGKYMRICHNCKPKKKGFIEKITSKDADKEFKEPDVVEVKKGKRKKNKDNYIPDWELNESDGSD